VGRDVAIDGGATAHRAEEDPMDRDGTRSAIRIVAALAAGSLAVAAAWNGLFDARIVVPEIPPGGNEALFAWWRPVEWQTAGIHLVAIVGFLAMAGLGVVLGSGLRAGARATGLIGATFLVVGGLVSALAHLVQLGGQQAILEASTTSMDPAVLGTIGFTVDRVTAALQLGGYAALGVGVFALIPSLGALSARPLQGGLAIVLAVGLFLLAVFAESDPFDLVGPLSIALGVVVLPAWAWVVSRVPDERFVRATVTAG
jgi:hypothetical protein